jgi:hypothetical protein
MSEEVKAKSAKIREALDKIETELAECRSILRGEAHGQA